MLVSAWPEVERRPRRVAVGEFDGVHLGHREVIRGCDTVLTFEPHPLAVIRPEAAPKLLTSLALKKELIAQLGVRELVVIPFDDEFARQSPDEFADRVLVDALGATHVSVGENFRFGRLAAGDTAMLRADGRFSTRVAPMVEADGEIISSSRIRALVAAGEVERADRLLGCPFQMRGEVVHGDHRGRVLGYPTANLVPDEQLACPGHGIYACLVRGAGDPGRGAGERSGEEPAAQEHVAAAVNVGVRPTFGTGRALLVEVHVLDFDGDLYGRELTVSFIGRLRGERMFHSAEALIAQMDRDVEDARSLLAQAGLC